MDRPLRIYLWLAFGITWGVGGLGLLAGAYQPDAASSASRALHYVACFGPSLAGLIMAGAIWWAWHLPTFFIPTLSQSHLSIPVFLLNSLALSVIMTWLYQRTRGDLLLMILVHLTANYCGAIGVPFNAEVSAEVACAAVIVAGGGLRSGARQD